MLGDPYFSFQKQILFTIVYTFSKNEQKNQCGKLKKFQVFCPPDMPSCGCKAQETMVAKCELVLQGTSTVNLIHLIGPLKQSLVENISLQRCNCNIFGLTDTMALFAKEAGFYRFWVFSGQVLSKTKSVTPHFFLHF